MAKMIKCRTCSNEIASNAKSCPSCGAKNKKPFYQRGWFFVLVFFIVVGVIDVAGKGDDSNSNNTSTTSTKSVSKPAPKKEKFEIVGDLDSNSDQFANYITGVIKNNSGRDCTYVQVTFNLYDTDGNQVGTALANINNLEKDGTWKFKAMGMNVDGQVSSYKLADITGY
ncbi:FxLYD domain-containing protein [Paraclostridium sordellii]|uniref:FxLYD domain-containing protein n=2 Tax=Paraclostridium sordellii TaxID=1505 RepID=UPI0005DC03DB|nr:FxLYD domain-containing protein [Paeniclostridium sordellii]CEN87283.1 Uncharacterised protein [[Clostridium] sordellii] [Paeniclostridium sordellii]CEN93260.1 Uncharacterised protein [[Clostridium] sordellii] [Paeniclostridium sordellii]CEN95467.1 Uncharacterised protein [[Clostridium] sordellii] [Paeniclostridium sordellii]CEP83929.1 Uncharacterised protein [[Clostridium] sordellii] [Paeniclostridium sordellii]